MRSEAHDQPKVVWFLSQQRATLQTLSNTRQPTSANMDSQDMDDVVISNKKRAREETDEQSASEGSDGWYSLANVLDNNSRLIV